MPPRLRRPALIAVGALILPAMGIAGCANDGDGTATSTPTVAEEMTDAPSGASAPTTGPSTTTRPTPTGPTIQVGSEARDYGDDPALDALWDRCAEGEGKACDELYYSAPVDSRYEDFGLTCGDRPNVILCAELDEEPGPTSLP